MEKSETIGALAGALAKAQGHIKGAVKDSSNPFFKSKYADLASIWEACRAALTANDLSVIQTFHSTADEGGEHLFLTTMLAHKSGEWISDTCECPVAKPDAQGYGSAITYIRRYALAAISGVAPLEDDDGEGAVGRKDGEQVVPERKARTRKPAAPVPAKDTDKQPQHILDARAKFFEFCRAHASYLERDEGPVRTEEAEKIRAAYGIKSLDELTEEQATKLIAELSQELEAMANG